jgi:hypothetical protein
MMSRGSSSNRAGPLVDPSSLQQRPVSQRMSSYGSLERPGLERRNSSIKPLLNFDNELQPPTLPGQRNPQSRSVFGVDTLWEREMVKLKEIEAQEKLEAERESQQQAEGTKSGKKRRKKDGPDVPPNQEMGGVPERTASVATKSSLEPPVLPEIGVTARSAPVRAEELDSDDSSDSDAVPSRAKPAPVVGWNSDDEGDGPRRTTGVGPRFPNPGKPSIKPHMQDESDEEKPLSYLMHKSTSSPQVPGLGGDDDDQPLGLRASSIRQDDDDQPLGLHPEQQRRTQYQMMQMAQYQQQQMMMQQMHNSMFFNPSMMTSGYFPPMAPTPNMMMQPTIPLPPSPPPMHDSAKLARLDRWRHEVAGES